MTAVAESEEIQIETIYDPDESDSMANQDDNTTVMVQVR